MEFHNKSELGNIATNHSPDIDLKHFMNIYIKCTSEPYSLLILHPSYESFKMQKKYFKFIIKITLTNKLKVLDDKIKVNQSQYDLDREAAKISALSSKELDKYEQ